MEYFQPLLSSTKLDMDGHDERLRQNAIKGLLQEEADVEAPSFSLDLFRSHVLFYKSEIV